MSNKYIYIYIPRIRFFVMSGLLKYEDGLTTQSQIEFKFRDELSDFCDNCKTICRKREELFSDLFFNAAH